MDNNKINILNINISKGSLKTILNETLKLLDSNEKFYVCAPNAYITVKANEDEEFLKILNNASIAIPDGMILVWYSKTFKKSLLGRISGFDFFYNFSKVADKRRYSYFFMGGRSKVVLKRIKERLGNNKSINYTNR